MGKGRIRKSVLGAALVGAVLGGGGSHSHNLNKANYDNGKNLYNSSRTAERDRNGRNARNAANDSNNRRRGTRQRY